MTEPLLSNCLFNLEFESLFGSPGVWPGVLFRFALCNYHMGSVSRVTPFPPAVGRTRQVWSSNSPIVPYSFPLLFVEEFLGCDSALRQHIRREYLLAAVESRQGSRQRTIFQARWIARRVP